MTTLSTLDVDFDRIFAAPVDMKSHPRCVIRDALNEHCERLPLSHAQIEAVIDAAQAERAFGASPAKAIAEGKKVAARIVTKMEAIRTRFGTRPDDAA